MIGLGFLASNMTGLIQTTFTLTGAVQGPLLGVFLLALFVPWANKYVSLAELISPYILKPYKNCFRARSLACCVATLFHSG